MKTSEILSRKHAADAQQLMAGTKQVFNRLLNPGTAMAERAAGKADQLKGLARSAETGGESRSAWNAAHAAGDAAEKAAGRAGGIDAGAKLLAGGAAGAGTAALLPPSSKSSPQPAAAVSDGKAAEAPVAPQDAATPPAPEKGMLERAGDWMGKSTNIGGVDINNGLLTAGGVGAAGLLAYLLSRKNGRDDEG